MKIQVKPIFLYGGLFSFFWGQILVADITFDSQSVKLEADATTALTTYTDTGLSVNLGGYSGAAFVMSTFSGKKSNSSNFFEADYQLYDYNSNSVLGQVHKRQIEKTSTAAGAGSALGIVNLSGNSVTLQHARTLYSQSNSLITLAGSTLTAIPLSSGTTDLSYASASQLLGVNTSLSDYSSVVTTTGSFNVPAVHEGTKEVFVAAAFDVIASGSGQGSWKLQFKPATGGVWQDVGNTAFRGVNSSEGIVTMVGLADISDAGDYIVRLVQAIDVAGGTLTTSNVDIAAISLSIDATQYLQSYETTVNGVDTTISMQLSLDEDMPVFAAANITANSSGNDTGTYFLSAIDDGSTSILASSTREVLSSSLGSVGLSSIYNFTAAGTNSITLTIDSAYLGFDSNSNFVAFELTSTTAIPEPATVGFLLGIGAFTLAMLRRGRLNHAGN